MKVLVTGHTGLVGGAVACALGEGGHEVVGVSRRRTLASQAGVVQVQADIGAPDFVAKVSQAVGPCEAVVHAAASLDMDPAATSVSMTNCVGTQQVLNLARIWGARRFLFISSVPVVGRPVDLPITEEHACHPLTAYHASKLYGERLVALAGESGIQGASLRITSPVGAGMPRRIVSIFVERALGNEPIVLNGKGTRRQDYVDVGDVADAVEAALTTDACGVFNVAGGEAVSNLDLARRTIEALGSQSAVEFSGKADGDDDVCWDVCLDKAREAFGYVPQHSLEDMLEAIASWMKER